jgi:tripeptidyl-peptidase II
MTRLLLVLLLVPTLGLSAGAKGDYYQFLSRDTVQATDFTKKHPTWDGRGVVVAILDTGVDPSVPGLRKTSTGKLKVIGARDFSGEGDVKLKKARTVTERGVAVLRTKDGFVRGVDTLKTRPSESGYWLGFFKESDLKNSAVKDVNGNGREDDQFAVLAFRPAGKEYAVFAIDLNGDGTLAGDELRREYKEELKWFRFTHPDPRKDQTPVAFTGTVRWDDKVVELHFDDGAHGTHCAGISAGYKLQGREGFDGIAPGAHVISLKIGNNSLAGGSTTPSSMRKAIEYASDWAKDHKVPVVINLSYGIGSAWEGKADIDKALDDALQDNPLLVASVAGGNDGPGISTIGTPGASARAWTAGALLTPANAEALWGGEIKRNRIFFFSSRGGELNKPDGLSPGVAWSTVPPFLKRNVMAGTSMATPQAAGVHALLISAARSEGVPWNSGTLKRALKASAVHVNGATSLDEGAGLIQTVKAYKVLKKTANKDMDSILLGWDIRTAVPNQPGNHASGSYWRTGHYTPSYPDVVSFKIKPVLFSGTTDKQRTEFFETLKLKSKAKWLKVDRGAVGVRAVNTTHVSVTIKRKSLSKAGLNVGHIVATARGSKAPAFTLPVTVVRPHRFDDEGSRTRRFRGKLVSGEIARMYLEVPPGARAMNLDFDVPKGEFGGNYLIVHDPEGHNLARGKAISASGKKFQRTFAGKALKPGVWEVVAYGSFRNHKVSHWKLDVSFHGLSFPKSVKYTITEGKGVSASAHVTNAYENVFVGSVKAKVSMKVRQKKLKIEGHKKEIRFTLGKDCDGADFDLKMSPHDYNKFTDIALNILDSTGRAVQRGGFGSPETHIGFKGKPGTYRLVIDGGTTLDETPKWKVHVRETHALKAPIPMTVSGPDGGTLSLYPQIPTKLSLETAVAPLQTPKGFHYGAMLVFTDKRSSKVWHRRVLDLKR